MRRVPTNTGKPVPHIEGEPDFYGIAKLHPLPPPVFEPSHAARPSTGIEATISSSTIPEPAASAAAPCMYPTSVSHMYSIHDQSRDNPSAAGNNRDFLSVAKNMTSSMSHLHVAAAHDGNARQIANLPFSRESSQPKSDCSTFYEAGTMHSYHQASNKDIRKPSSQSDTTSSDEHTSYYHSTHPTTTTTATTTAAIMNIQHPTPNYLFPAPSSSHNYQQNVDAASFPNYHQPHPYFYQQHPRDEDGTSASWSSSSTAYYFPPAQSYPSSYPPAAMLVNPLNFESGSRYATHQHSFAHVEQQQPMQGLPLSPRFAVQELHHPDRPTRERQLRASDQAQENRRNGKESDGSSGNDDSVNDFLGSFDF
jgi:hypothetical protein